MADSSGDCWWLILKRMKIRTVFFFNSWQQKIISLFRVKHSFKNYVFQAVDQKYILCNLQ